MKLITEVNDDIEFTRLINEENENGEKQYFIEGIFLQGNVKNRNGRIYPSDVLDKQVSEYNANYIQKNRALGELGHPDGPTVNYDRVSHKIESLKRDGDNWIGRAKILDTPNGRIVKSLLDEGVQLGVSSRGLGSVKQKGNHNEVQDDFHLVTAADIVADPSAPNAFVEGIMEGKEWVLEGGVFKQVEPQRIIETTKQQIEKVVTEEKDRTKRQEAFIHLFYEHLSKLNK